MNGRRAKKLKRLAQGATVAGAYPAAKRWWEWLCADDRGAITGFVNAGKLDSLGAGWRSTFVTPTDGAPPPVRKPERNRLSGALKRRKRPVHGY